MSESLKPKAKPERVPPGVGVEVAIAQEDKLTPARYETRVWVIVAVAFVARVTLMTIGHTYRFAPRDDHFGLGWETGRIARPTALGQGFSNPLRGITGPRAWLAAL